MSTVHSYGRLHDNNHEYELPSKAGSADDIEPVAAGKLRALSPKGTLLILDRRTLERECFAESLLSHNIGMEVLALASVAEWRVEEDFHAPLSVLVLSIGGRRMSDPGCIAELTGLTSEFPGVPVVVLADTDELEQILLALEKGARGYIPTSVGVHVCMEAIALAIAGGTFVPASSLVSMREMIGLRSQSSRPMAGLFTQRQEEVARALRRGKANKIIAYELNLRESTVKVHIRNIMKKLKATNRTEVAYKINEMLSDEVDLEG